MRWAPLIVRSARQYRLSPSLLAGLVWQESSANPWAIRVEKSFWDRYAEGIARWVKSTKSTADDKWARYPDIYASSLGLAQIMLQTAAEHGFTYQFPTELLDPETNLDMGARILSRLIAREGGDVRKGLLRYNGGGDPEYPANVLAHAKQIEAAGVLGTEA